MTSTAPSPEDFLAAPPDPDEEEPEHEPVRTTIFETSPEALSSIADSLERLVIIAADIRSAGRNAPVAVVPASDFEDVRRERDELENLHDRKSALIEEVLLLIKPSTAKLSNQVRALLEGPVTPDPTTGSTDAASATTEPSVAGSPSTAGAGSDEIPSDQAPIEEWIAFARRRGLEVDPGRTNRSMIRTALGISQPVKKNA